MVFDAVIMIIIIIIMIIIMIMVIIIITIMIIKNNIYLKRVTQSNGKDLP